MNNNRFTITLVNIAGPSKSTEYQSAVANPKNGIYVDAVIAASDHALDLNPRSIIVNLRTLVTIPSSSLYRTNIGRKVDSSFGILTLTPGTHDPDNQNVPSSVQVAQQELAKAQQNHGSDGISYFYFNLI